MIRTITCALLFSCTGVQAEQLYRWVEEDGSITFSPNLPAAGIDYQSVGSATAPGQPETDPVTALKTDPQILRYAPETTRNATAQADQQTNTAEPITQATTPLITASTGSKRRHCQDLQKRVISLERRMRADLTADDMDNTVIHMARYQRSFDQFCAQ